MRCSNCFGKRTTIKNIKVVNRDGSVLLTVGTDAPNQCNDVKQLEGCGMEGVDFKSGNKKMSAVAHGEKSWLVVGG